MRFTVDSFLINNDGYTIERAIHGPDEAYNDITTWDHRHMLQFLGARDGAQCTRQVRTKEEMETVLDSAEFVDKAPSQIQLLEVFMDRLDIPWRLAKQIEIVNERMRKEDPVLIGRNEV